MTFSESDRVWKAAFRHRAFGGFALLILAGSGGCGGRSTSRHYDALVGTVEGVQADVGQLTVRTVGLDGAVADEKLSCLLTNDSEVYVNDRFSEFSTIQIGDTVELVGYRERSPQGERFVVTLAQITRNIPLPPPPDLSPPATNPAQPPEES